MADRISIIISAKNRIQTLPSVLACLARQTISGDDLEVVVVDDGSTDGTQERLCASSYPFRFVYERLVSRPCFCPARPRNRGLHAATGEVVVFLDADILTVQHFAAAHLSAHQTAAGPTAVIGYTHGYELGGGLVDVELPDPPALVLQIDDFLRQRGEQLRDCRDVEYSKSDDLRKHSTPWRFFWGNNVSVRRNVALEVGGFDEDFTGWGVEDIEFAYRLYRKRAAFQVSRAARGFHFPHAVAPRGERDHSLDHNRRQMIRKHASAELEMHMWAGPSGEWAWKQVVPLHQQPAPPGWNSNEFCKVAATVRRHLSSAAPVAWFGPVDTIPVGDKAACSLFAQQGRSDIAELMPLAGVFTPWADCAFGSVLVWDYWRWLPAPLIKGIVREGLRLSGQVVLVNSGTGPSNPVPLAAQPISDALGAAREARPGLGCHNLAEDTEDLGIYLIRSIHS